MAIYLSYTVSDCYTPLVLSNWVFVDCEVTLSDHEYPLVTTLFARNVLTSVLTVSPSGVRRSELGHLPTSIRPAMAVIVNGPGQMDLTDRPVPSSQIEGAMASGADERCVAKVPTNDPHHVLEARWVGDVFRHLR